MTDRQRDELTDDKNANSSTVTLTDKHRK